MTATALRYEQVGHAFGEDTDERFVALTGVDLHIREGEFVSLVGPSGCGKSTLLRITAGLLNCTEGRVRAGDDIVSAPRPGTGLMLQTPTLFPWRTVMRNITLPLEVAGADVAAHRHRVDEVLDLVGLSEFAEKRPGELSGGMQQRVALCRLLVADPTLMLMDEPFGALDEFTREHLNNELARISDHENKTTIFVTHNIEEAVFLSDRVVVMGNSPGRVLEVVDVDIPRPRRPSVRADPAFVETVSVIRRIFGLA